mmetsp:Transcript_36022/g.84105  ORF Transcript_36022/g.84105 Transcript_36022/m.84105 type:complete len:133 (-) Transcript_36022:2459-2857(-)
MTIDSINNKNIGMNKKFISCRRLIKPTATIEKSPADRPNVATMFESNPELNVPIANLTGITLLNIDMITLSHACNIENDNTVPKIYRRGPIAKCSPSLYVLLSPFRKSLKSIINRKPDAAIEKRNVIKILSS